MHTIESGADAIKKFTPSLGIPNFPRSLGS